MITVLENLKAGRKLLEVVYVPFYFDDQRGGYCAQGALAQTDGSKCSRPIGWVEVEEAAWRLHPELKGAVAARFANSFLFDNDSFDRSPATYVNNHLGKEAILAVFDDAIQHEEMRLLCEDEALKQRVQIGGLVAELQRPVDADPMSVEVVK